MGAQKGEQRTVQRNGSEESYSMAAKAAADKTKVLK